MYMRMYIPEEENKNEKSVESTFEQTAGNFFKSDTYISFAMYISIFIIIVLLQM